MPLLANDTDGAVTRKRLETWAAYQEKVTVVAAADEATTLSAATLAGAHRVVVTQTPGAARAITTPTGALLGAAFTDEGVGSSFEVTIVNLAASTHVITFTAGATGVTIVGLATVAPATSATFVGVFTAANTVSFYRE